MQKSAEELIRERIANWVNTAPIQEVLRHVPSGAFTDETLMLSGKTASGRRKKILKHAQRKLLPGESDIIRNELKRLVVDSPEYKERRDSLCRDRGLTRLQIAGIFSGTIASTVKYKNKRPETEESQNGASSAQVSA